jgi:hypothetical protein
MNTVNFSQILSSTITPVTLLTGVAFITSIMAPRFGRCIDRIRSILSQIRDLDSESPARRPYQKQLEILYRRTKLLRNAMVAAGLCILFITLTVGVNFINLVSGMNDSLASVVFFLLALVCLFLVAIGFTFDFVISLEAVKFEIEGNYRLSKTQALLSPRGLDESQAFGVERKVNS